MSPANDASEASPPARKGLRITLWMLQLFMALLFGAAGFMKLTQPIAELIPKLPWVNDVPAFLVRFIGLSELSGALGLVLPAATRIKPQLSPLAAVGLSTVLALAACFHLFRGEPFAILGNAMLAAPLVFIAWGRTRKAVISARA